MDSSEELTRNSGREWGGVIKEAEKKESEKGEKRL